MLIKTRPGEPDMASLFTDIPEALPAELFETVVCSNTAKIERIVSRGHASPAGFWYDQPDNEFVLVIQGSAGIRFENDENVVTLKAGDYLNIGAHVRHRVEWTDAACDTIWLAVHY